MLSSRDKQTLRADLEKAKDWLHAQPTYHNQETGKLPTAKVIEFPAESK